MARFRVRDTASPATRPDSAHAASVRASVVSESARRQVIKFFGADGGEWDVVFVQGATGGLRLLAHEFSWGEGAVLFHEAHCHTSLLGMRECVRLAARRGGVRARARLTLAAPPRPAEYALHVAGTWSRCRTARCVRGRWMRAMGLAAGRGRGAWWPCPVSATSAATSTPLRPWPAFGRRSPPAATGAPPAPAPGTGRCPPLTTRRSGDAGVFFVLDTAKWASTSPVDLGALRFVDAAVVSFYKLFGYPTGLGALLVRKGQCPTPCSHPSS